MSKKGKCAGFDGRGCGFSDLGGGQGGPPWPRVRSATVLDLPAGFKITIPASERDAIGPHEIFRRVFRYSTEAHDAAREAFPNAVIDVRHGGFGAREDDVVERDGPRGRGVYPDPLDKTQVTSIGTIIGPGKFEGELYYIPYYWDLAMNGMADEEITDPADDITYSVFVFGIEDQHYFNIPDGATELWLHERSDGFVVATFTTKKQAAHYRKQIEEAEEAAADDEDRGDL